MTDVLFVLLGNMNVDGIVALVMVVMVRIMMRKRIIMMRRRRIITR